MIRVLPFCMFFIAGSYIASATTIYDTTVLGNGPVAFFPLDEMSGTTANNLANTNENGTYHGVALGVSGGPDGSGAGFTPVGTYVGAPNYPAIDATSAFSIEAWVNVSSASANGLGDIFAINRQANGTGIALWLNGDHPELGLNNGANFAELSTGSVTNNAWNQIVVTWNNAVNGGAPLFYINGALAGNSDASAFTGALGLTNAPGLNIGAEFASQLNPGGRWFNGSIEEVSFYNYALSPNQVSADFAAAAPEPSSLLMIAGGLMWLALVRFKRTGLLTQRGRV